jgi:hypothetical protein
MQYNSDIDIQKSEIDQSKDKKGDGGETVDSESAWPLAGSTFSSKLPRDNVSEFDSVNKSEHINQSHVDSVPEHKPAAFFGSTIGTHTHSLSHWKTHIFLAFISKSFVFLIMYVCVCPS